MDERELTKRIKRQHEMDRSIVQSTVLATYRTWQDESDAERKTRLDSANIVGAFNADLAWLIDHGTGGVFPKIVANLVASFIVISTDPWAKLEEEKAAYAGPPSFFATMSIVLWTWLRTRVNTAYGMMSLVAGPADRITKDKQQYRVYTIKSGISEANVAACKAMEDAALAKRTAILEAAARGVTTAKHHGELYESCAACFLPIPSYGQYLFIGSNHIKHDGRVDITEEPLRRMHCALCNPGGTPDAYIDPDGAIALGFTDTYTRAVAERLRQKQVEHKRKRKAPAAAAPAESSSSSSAAAK
jgi:hypothetical protein